jgi:hypothetical protein
MEVLHFGEAGQLRTPYRRDMFRHISFVRLPVGQQDMYVIITPQLVYVPYWLLR